LGIDEGETIHGIRGGCAMTMSVMGCGNREDVMDHVGWFSKKSLERYSRLGKMTKLGVSGNLMRQITKNPDGVANIFKNLGDPCALPNAF
jgi:16S rRNA C1402 (ribose-2'-O) methylase RsmI